MELKNMMSFLIGAVMAVQHMAFTTNGLISNQRVARHQQVRLNMFNYIDPSGLADPRDWPEDDAEPLDIDPLKNTWRLAQEQAEEVEAFRQELQSFWDAQEAPSLTAVGGPRSQEHCLSSANMEEKAWQ